MMGDEEDDRDPRPIAESPDDDPLRFMEKATAINAEDIKKNMKYAPARQVSTASSFDVSSTVLSRSVTGREFGHQAGTKSNVPFHVKFLSWDWKNQLKDQVVEHAMYVADGMPAPVRAVFDFIWLFRRPSLVPYLPSALIHFLLVESGSTYIVAICWFNICVTRLSNLWLSSRMLDPMMDCSHTYAYAALTAPLDSELNYECRDIGFPRDSEVSGWLVPYSGVCDAMHNFETPKRHHRLAMLVAFYVPLMLLALLKLYRLVQFGRYCGTSCGKPASFASGTYLIFCWRMARSRVHKLMLRSILAIFLLAVIFIAIEGRITGIGLDGSARSTALLHISVMLTKLDELARESVPEHRFENLEFIQGTTFHRTWLDLFSESGFQFAYRLIDALWRFKAGDARLLSKMLEKSRNTRNGATKFFLHCDRAQIHESREQDIKENFEASDDQVETAAEIMFGESLVEEDPKETMAEALAIKAETDQRIAMVKQRFGDEIRRAREMVASADAEKKEALSRAAKLERDLEGLRCLGEKLMMRELECARLRAEVEDLSAKDTRNRRLTDEIQKLKESVTGFKEENERLHAMLHSGSYLRSSIHRSVVGGSTGFGADASPRAAPSTSEASSFSELNPSETGKVPPVSARAKAPGDHWVPPSTSIPVGVLGSSLTTTRTLPARPGAV